MTNILNAIHNIVNQSAYKVADVAGFSHNRATGMGEALEKYIKDAFAETFDNDDLEEIYSEKFSWLGNKTNPPDFIIRGGDAVEVKKIESSGSDLALNSSYPKSKLHSDSTLITAGCRSCEDWTEKDIIYAVGHTKNQILRSLWMVYGDVYAADREIYENLHTRLSQIIRKGENIEFSETKELGRINRVDPLGITYLRMRGMWGIRNPNKVFQTYLPQGNKAFTFISVIPADKYNSFPEESRIQLENIQLDNFNILDSRVSNPNNPANRIDVKVISFYID